MYFKISVLSTEQRNSMTLHLEYILHTLILTSALRNICSPFPQCTQALSVEPDMYVSMPLTEAVYELCFMNTSGTPGIVEPPGIGKRLQATEVLQPGLAKSFSYLEQQFSFMTLCHMHLLFYPSHFNDDKMIAGARIKRICLLC